MLVSYDFNSNSTMSCAVLQGHQNVGELRLEYLIERLFYIKLQGHQNVGELRHSITAQCCCNKIAGSPECW